MKNLLCRRVRPKRLDVNGIVDALEELDRLEVDTIVWEGPDGDNSDGNDESEPEDDNPARMTRNVLTAPVTEIRVGAGSQQLLEWMDKDGNGKIIDEEEPVNDEPVAMDAQAEPVDEPEAKKFRDHWVWEEELSSFRSKCDAPFPEQNYTRFSQLSPHELFDLFFDDNILTVVAEKTKEHAMAQFSMACNITLDEIKVFFAVLLLSGYLSATELRMFWSVSEDTENRMLKKAISRDRFLLIKRCFHLGSIPDQPGATPDRYWYKIQIQWWVGGGERTFWIHF